MHAASTNSQQGRVAGSTRDLLRGLVISALLGFAVALLIAFLVRLVFNGTFWPKIIIAPTWLTLSYLYFRAGLVEVGTFQAAFRSLFNIPNENLIFTGGQFWIARGFEKMTITPGPEQPFYMTMPKDTPEAKDLIKVFIGYERGCQLVIRVVNPIRYSKASNPSVDSGIEDLFLDQVRLFVNKMSYAAGIMNEKSLLEEFLELDRANPDFPTKRREVAQKLSGLTVDRPEDDTGTLVPQHVFTPDAVEAVMERAGDLQRTVQERGMVIDDVLSPSIDLPPEIDAAASKKQVQIEENEVFDLKADAIRRQAKQMTTELNVSGADALDRVGMILGQNVERTSAEYTLNGLDGLNELAGQFGRAMRKASPRGGPAATQQEGKGS